METVREILTRVGYRSVEEMDINDGVTLESDEFEDLMIEKVGDDLLSVSQYYVQRGDIISDPEVHFKLVGQNWIPIRFIQDPSIEREDPSGLDIDEFLKIWDRNLRRQGFVDSASE